MTQHAASTVLLSDAEGSRAVAERLAVPGRGPVPMYATLEELVAREALESIDVLVVYCPPVPKGVLLATLGRLNLEYPRMQKVVVLEGPLPLPVVEYLVASGVERVDAAGAPGAPGTTAPAGMGRSVRAAGSGGGDGGGRAMDRLEAVMDRVHERTGWLAG